MNAPHEYQDSLQQFCQTSLNDVSAYRNNQALGHMNALANNFMLVKNMLGDSIFNALAYVYYEHFPASAWDINLYGEHFAELIKGQQQGGKADLFDWPLISQVAELEYALIKAYYTPEDSAFCEELKLGNPENIIPAIAHYHPYVTYTERSLTSELITITQQNTQGHFALKIDKAST